MGIDANSGKIAKREINISYNLSNIGRACGTWVAADDVLMLNDGLTWPTLYHVQSSGTRVLYRRGQGCEKAEEKLAKMREIVEAELEDEAKFKHAMAAARRCARAS